jgi:hypothetical protein
LVPAFQIASRKAPSLNLAMAGGCLLIIPPSGKMTEILPVFELFRPFFHCTVAAFQVLPIQGDVNISVHITKEWYFTQGVLSYKNWSDLIDANGRNIEIRKVVGAKNVLLPHIQLSE